MHVFLFSMVFYYNHCVCQRVSIKKLDDDDDDDDDDVDWCDWQDGKKGFHDSDDEDDDDDDFEGLFSDAAGSFSKTSQDRLASEPNVRSISLI